MGSTLKGTVSILINNLVFNFLNKFRELLDYAGIRIKKYKRILLSVHGTLPALNLIGKLGFFASKWDTDTTEQNLARLDGISKPPRRPPTIEDFLQMDGDDFGTDDCDTAGGASSSGKKRVRWADIEERKAQRKMRQMGFVVGVTDWSRMMDPTEGGSALTKTKYIERVRRNF